MDDDTRSIGEFVGESLNELGIDPDDIEAQDAWLDEVTAKDIAQAVICQREDHFADMYPEFAPDPIVVKCERPAVVYLEEDAGALSPTPESWVVCQKHALEMVEHCFGESVGFRMRTLTDEDRREYVKGTHHALTTEITDHQALVAAHEGFLEAGLHTPEHSTELFDAGWEWAMAGRVARMVWVEEVEG